MLAASLGPTGGQSLGMPKAYVAVHVHRLPDVSIHLLRAKGRVGRLSTSPSSTNLSVAN